MMNDSTIHLSKQQINKLPLERYQGPITLISHATDLKAVERQLSGKKVLGFDTETRPAFSKHQSYPTALLQLADEGMVYLFQLQRLKCIPDFLLHIFESEQVVKAGVAIADDIKKLQVIKPFKAAGFIELSTLSSQLHYKNNGLRGLVAACFGKRISKRQRLTNWERHELTESQMRYAATDAWMSLHLYDYLISQVPNEPVDENKLAKMTIPFTNH